MGDKGVGKTFAMDAAARLLTGLVETNKFNNLTDTRTLLHCSGTSTLPITIEDNESSSKVRNKYIDSACPNSVIILGGKISCSQL